MQGLWANGPKLAKYYFRKINWKEQKSGIRSAKWEGINLVNFEDPHSFNY